MCLFHGSRLPGSSRFRAMTVLPGVQWFSQGIGVAPPGPGWFVVGRQGGSPRGQVSGTGWFVDRQEGSRRFTQGSQ